MSISKTGASLLFVLSMAVAIPASANTVVIGQPADLADGNCYPFGCSYSGNYQQVYSGSQFGGPITITGLEFYNTVYNSFGTALPSGNFAISLSTTGAGWDTLSSNAAANLGSDNTLVFNGSLAKPWTFGDTLVIPFSTSYAYNPASGNLLLTVDSSTTQSGTNIYFDLNSSNNYLGRVYNLGGNPSGGVGVDPGYGLVTGFESNAAAAAPEPGSLLLLSAGLIGMGAMARRRNSKK